MVRGRGGVRGVVSGEGEGWGEGSGSEVYW